MMPLSEYLDFFFKTVATPPPMLWNRCISVLLLGEVYYRCISVLLLGEVYYRCISVLLLGLVYWCIATGTGVLVYCYWDRYSCIATGTGVFVYCYWDRCISVLLLGQVYWCIGTGTGVFVYCYWDRCIGSFVCWCRVYRTGFIVVSKGK